MAESDKIRCRYFREILLNTAIIREVNSTEIDSNFMARETQDYAPCHFKANRDKLVLTIVDGCVKEGKSRTSTVNF